MEYPPPKYLTILAFMYGRISVKEMIELIEARDQKEDK